MAAAVKLRRSENLSPTPKPPPRKAGFSGNEAFPVRRCQQGLRQDQGGLPPFLPRRCEPAQDSADRTTVLTAADAATRDQERKRWGQGHLRAFKVGTKGVYTEDFDPGLSPGNRPYPLLRGRRKSRAARGKIADLLVHLRNWRNLVWQRQRSLPDVKEWAVSLKTLLKFRRG